jgi:hypothetical protein
MRLVLLIVVALWAAACAAPPASTNVVPTPIPGGFQTSMQSVPVDGQLTLEVRNKDRQVKPASDTSFDLKMANLTGSALPVTVVLEHAEGERWRTSLCVQRQCILGNGTEPSVAEVVVLPPYFEQPFQAHLFVDEDAGRGQRGALSVRVEPQTAGVAPRSVTLSAEVVN